ncbi:MAG: TatD family hydrolase [Erysipelotrichaceae bacterium]|nr:TatD family hydrolase [Erysipelotrichaceae bacterium]MDY5253008.1 TatD family hydrolase [Erysipelotrichaceae bacterium]
MSWIDSHCHIIDETFDDQAAVIARIKQQDIARCMIVCCYAHEYEKALALAKEDPRFKVAVGIHPSDVKNLDEKTWEQFLTYANKEEVCAIGEIGLDYYWDKDNKEQQKAYFIKQIEIAKSLNKPIIVHSRDALQDTFDILKEHRCKGVLHCYSGSKEMAVEFEKLGYYISLAGPVTFKNAHEPKEVAKAIALEHLLIETDCPYLTPEPYRGKRNEPAYVVYVGKKIAELKEIDEESLQKQLVINFDKLFKGE